MPKTTKAHIWLPAEKIAEIMEIYPDIDTIVLEARGYDPIILHVSKGKKEG